MGRRLSEATEFVSQAVRFKKLVLNRRPLSDRPIWLGDRCEGTLMGQELGLECADMNHSFLFRNRQGRPRDLKYSSDALNNDRRYYKISEVLDCVKEAKTDYLHRFQGEIL